MTREVGPEIVRNDASVVTTGTFDGVHLGHQAILRYLVARARAVGGVPTVVTFSPHPREVVGGDAVPLLTTLDERADLLAGLGVERFVVLPFTRDLSLLEPDAYVERVLRETIGLREIVIGYDHRFGQGRTGSRETLEELGARDGFTVDVIPEQIERGITVSSTQIRQLLLDAGDAEAAAALLGRPYRITGTVVHGDARGRLIGFPTANVQPADARKLVPRLGVYAVRLSLRDGTVWGGMMNVGRRPTFETDGAVRAEVHVFNFSGDLYGHAVAVDVMARIRDEMRFEGVAALVARLGEDRAEALAALAPLPS